MFRFGFTFLLAVGVSIWAWFSDWWSNPVKMGPAIVCFAFTIANQTAIYEQHEELEGRVRLLENELKKINIVE